MPAAPPPIQYGRWHVTVRRGRLRGFVGRAVHQANGRELKTHEHTGRGARLAALRDITILVEVELALAVAEVD